MIAACYRRDEAQNPELFADALALVLGDYPADIVRMAVDPRTGVISRFPMGLPNVGQIKEMLDDLVAKQERLARYAALPKPTKRFAADQCVKTANLFVPDNVPRYAKMVEKHQKDGTRGSFFETRACSDGVTRNGIWVPLDWWEEPMADERKREPRPLQVSDHLKALIARQTGDAAA